MSSASTSKYNYARFSRIKFSGVSNADKIKYAYTRVALLFCTSILITWVPASINRVYGLRNPDNPSFSLNVGSAIVLPLQGFWNTVIYFVTSLGIWKVILREWREKRAITEIVHMGGGRVEEGESNEQRHSRSTVALDEMRGSDEHNDGGSTVALNDMRDRDSGDAV